MVEWLRTEFGGVILSLLGYAARALVDEAIPRWQTVVARVALAIICGVLAQAIVPDPTPGWVKAAVLVLVGLCTKELVQLFMRLGLGRLEREIERNGN
jgi:uncharacterized membrane protein YeaQ/YmgE (transglycosylase-associated protein family)